MRATYLVLSRLIALLVVVQAMAIVWAVSGLFKWIDEGATLDKSVIEGWEDTPPDFEGSFGSFLHFFAVGQGLIPLAGLLLLIVAFFAKVPRGVMLAVIVVVAIVVQILLGMNAQGTPLFGMLHGLGAFVLFGSALAASMAAKKAGSPQEASTPAV